MKGRPILGMISGFLFGLFGGITLFLYGVVPLASQLLWILPLLGIVLGIFMAAWAPFGKSAPTTDTATTEGVTYAGTGGATLEQNTIEVELKPADDTADEDGTES